LKQKPSTQEWRAEFSEFLNAPSLRPPPHLTDEILDFVRRDLNPNIKIVLAKLVGIHLIFGSLSLLVCSQFGMGTETSMTHYFSRAGEYGCMAFCGALFLGTSALAAASFLRVPELRVIRELGYLPLLGLGLLSLMSFMIYGTPLLAGLFTAWLAGGFLAGLIITEFGFQMRKH
jgi:hypothetical protein